MRGEHPEPFVVKDFIKQTLTSERAALREKVEENHKKELAELYASDNSPSTKAYIEKGLEVYKTSVLALLAEPKEGVQPLT